MNKLNVILSLIFVFSTVDAHDVQLFGKANEHYRLLEYKKAAETYQQIEKKGASVYYNMGNAYYRLKRKGQALAFWLKALKRTSVFSASEIRYNCLILLNSMLGKDEHLTFRQYLRLYTLPLQGIPLGWLQLMLLLSVLLMLIGLRFIPIFEFVWVQTVAGAAIGLCALLMFAHIWLTSTSLAVVTQQANLFSGPDAQFQVLSSVSEGSQVFVQRQSHDFYKVRFGAQNGWMSTSVIEKV